MVLRKNGSGKRFPNAKSFCYCFILLFFHLFEYRVIAEHGRINRKNEKSAAGNFAFPAAFFIVESLDALKLAHKFLLLGFDTHIGGAGPVSGRIVGVAGVGDYEQRNFLPGVRREVRFQRRPLEIEDGRFGERLFGLGHEGAVAVEFRDRDLEFNSVSPVGAVFSPGAHFERAVFFRNRKVIPENRSARLAAAVVNRHDFLTPPHGTSDIKLLVAFVLVKSRDAACPRTCT